MIGRNTYSDASDIKSGSRRNMGAAHITEQQKQIIRERRTRECFTVINRGLLWYNCLTIEQKSELNGWYHKWLNATETGIIPVRPKWLDDKIEREEILL